MLEYFVFSAGRPQIDVDFEDIELLRQLHFNWIRISEIRRSTVYQRLREEGVMEHLTYSDISDSALDTLVQQIKQQHPNDGER